MAKFKHVWTSPKNLSPTWQLIAACFEDSKRSPIWPNDLAEIHARGGKLHLGSPIVAFYKIGPMKSEAHYRIARFEPNHLLRYETTEEHPLKGHATIKVTEQPDGGTRCEWSGEYKLKNALSVGSLAWFKLVYEKRFFSRFIANFERLRTRRPRQRHSRAA